MRGTQSLPSLRPAALALLALLSCRSERPPPANPPSIVADLKNTTLKVTSEPTAAVVLLSGEPAGKTPLTLTVDTGKEYRVEVRAPDLLPHAEKVFAAPHVPLEVAAILKPGAHVSVTTEPPGAHVSVDGQPAFDAPGRSAPLAPGKHLLVASADTLASESYEVQTAGAEELTWTVKLEPAVAVEVASTPPGAAIFVDDKPVGQTTPAVVQVKRSGKRHSLRLQREGYAPVERPLVGLAAAKGPLKVEAELVTVEVAELRSKIASLEKQVAKDERELKKLEGRVTGGAFVANAGKEVALRSSIEALEARVEQAHAELGELREKLEQQAVSAAP